MFGGIRCVSRCCREAFPWLPFKDLLSLPLQRTAAENLIVKAQAFEQQFEPLLGSPLRHCRLNSAMDSEFAQVMAPNLPGAWVGGQIFRWKHILPAPFLGRAAVPSVKRPRQIDRPATL